MDMPQYQPTNLPQTQPFEPCSEAWINGRIALLLSAYRRDDYQNPDLFVSQVSENFKRYPKAIVEFVTDPVTGIQAKKQWPPSVAEIVAACEGQAANVEKIARYSALQMQRPKDRARALNWANCYVGSEAPQYRKMLDKANKAETDRREYRYDEERGGIWVSLKWIWG